MPQTASPQSPEPRWTATGDGSWSSPTAIVSPALSGAAGLGPSPAAAASPSTAGPAVAASGRHVHASTLVDALRESAQAQQGAARHRATGPVDTVQLLSAAVDGSGQDQAGAQAEAQGGTSLGALAEPGTAGVALLSTEAAAQRSTAATAGSTDALLLLTTVGAALALAGTALETARRQRVRAAVARGHGRRALR